MRIERAWFLLAALIGACAIPNVEIVDSLDGASGTSNHAGTKGSAGKAGSANPTTGAGTDSGGAPDMGQGGEPSLGGTPTGGSGGSRPTGGTGGSGSLPPSGAVAKFCNGVTYLGQAVDLQLRIGTGASMVKITASTGTCQPVVSHDCTPITTGTKTVEVYFPDGTAFWTGSTVTVKAGQAWVFVAYYDDAAQMGMFNGTPGSPALTADECASVDFSDLFPAAPPRPGGS